MFTIIAFEKISNFMIFSSGALYSHTWSLNDPIHTAMESCWYMLSKETVVRSRQILKFGFRFVWQILPQKRCFARFSEFCNFLTTKWFSMKLESVNKQVELYRKTYFSKLSLVIYSRTSSSKLSIFRVQKIWESEHLWPAPTPRCKGLGFQ